MPKTERRLVLVGLLTFGHTGKMARDAEREVRSVGTADSWASSEAVRRSMVGNRSRDTSPELVVRSAIHRSGLRYRVAARPLPELRRTADLLFRPAKVAVFIDGCFWHGCAEHYAEPRTNTDYWSAKVERNMQRDVDTNRRLREAGWVVLRYWEHESVDQITREIIDIVEARRSR